MATCPVQLLIILLLLPPPNPLDDYDDDNYNYSRTLISELARNVDKNQKTFRIQPVHVMH